VPKTPRLREWRDRAALSQEELHTRSGVSRATIADLEAGNRGAQPRTIRKLAEALHVEPDALYGGPEHPLVEAPPSSQPTLNGELEEERRLRYLQGWRVFRVFVQGLARRWRETPPKTSTEIAPIFDTLTALAEQGVFEHSAAPDMREFEEFTLIMAGFEKLNEIASKVEEDEQTKQQRSTVIRDIREKLSA
jgi:HTH-type transcriptional regulator, competence development regulator